MNQDTIYTEAEIDKIMLDDFLDTLLPEIRDVLTSRGVTTNEDLKQFKMTLEINGEEVPIITMTKGKRIVRTIMHQWEYDPKTRTTTRRTS